VNEFINFSKSSLKEYLTEGLSTIIIQPYGDGLLIQFNKNREFANQTSQLKQQLINVINLPKGECHLARDVGQCIPGDFAFVAEHLEV
jgi:hypothetical protein